MVALSNEDLEPAAWEYDAVQYDSDGRKEVKVANVDPMEDWPGEEPLVRVSDVLDDLERAQMAAQERSKSADELLRQKLKRLRENGLNSETEDDNQ